LWPHPAENSGTSNTVLKVKEKLSLGAYPDISLAAARRAENKPEISLQMALTVSGDIKRPRKPQVLRKQKPLKLLPVSGIQSFQAAEPKVTAIR